MRKRGLQGRVLCAVSSFGWDCSTDDSIDEGAVTLWTVDSLPAVTIGFGRETPEYQFERILWATRLSDGRIVVVDQGSSLSRRVSPST